MTERDPELYEDGDYWTTGIAALDYPDWAPPEEDDA